MYTSHLPCGHTWEMGGHIGATWQIRFNRLRRAGGDAVLCHYILELVLGPHQSTAFDDLYIIWGVTAQGSAFGGCNETAPHLRGHISQKPNFGGVNRHFQA